MIMYILHYAFIASNMFTHHERVLYIIIYELNVYMAICFNIFNVSYTVRRFGCLSPIAVLNEGESVSKPGM